MKNFLRAENEVPYVKDLFYRRPFETIPINKLDFNDSDFQMDLRQLELLKKDIALNGINELVHYRKNDEGREVIEGIETVHAVKSLIEEGILPPNQIIYIKEVNGDDSVFLNLGETSILELDQCPVFWPLSSWEDLFRVNPMFTPNYGLLPISKQIELHLTILQQQICGVYVYSIKKNEIQSETYDPRLFFSQPHSLEGYSISFDGEIVYQLIPAYSGYLMGSECDFPLLHCDIPHFAEVDGVYHFYLSGNSRRYILKQFEQLYELFFLPTFLEHEFKFYHGNLVGGQVSITRIGSPNPRMKAYGFYGEIKEVSAQLPLLLEQYGVEDESEYIVSITPGSKENQILAQTRTHLTSLIDMAIG